MSKRYQESTRHVVRWSVAAAATVLFLLSPVPAESPEERLLAGHQERNAGRFAEAEEIYRSLLDDPVIEGAAREALAKVLSWQRKYDEAIEQYNLLRDRHPEMTLTAELGIARSYAWGGNFPEAVESLEGSLAAHPDDPDLLLLLGQVESWAGHTDRSLAAFDRLLEVDPGNGDALLGRARSLSWSGDFLEAEKQLKKMLEDNPGNVEARVALTHNLIWMRRPKDAAGILGAAAPKDRDRRDVRLANVSLSRSMGDRVAYRKEMQTLREQFPGNREVLNFSRLERNEVGPHIRTLVAYTSDSDDLEVMRYMLSASFPVIPRAYVFVEQSRSDVSFPDNDRKVDDTRAGLDIALDHGIGLRVWGGRRSGDGGMTDETLAGVRMSFRPLSNVRMSAGYSQDYADYTPRAADNNVRLRTLDGSIFYAATNKLNLRGSITKGWYDADAFSQDRDMFVASAKWAIARKGKIRFHTGVRATYFTFGETEPDPDFYTGYYNPSKFRRLLPFVTITRRYKDRSRIEGEIGYGIKKVEDQDWEDAGSASMVVALPIARQVDLTARASYSRLSITTGNYSSISGSLGLIIRLR